MGVTQALGGNGPCRVLSDSETTELNEWSWNSHSNMLYIDQPVQTGFSYDTATPGRLNLVSLAVDRAVAGAEKTERLLGFNQNTGELAEPGNGGLYIEGVFGSGDMAKTAVTTARAAEAIWDFMQVWMAEKKFKDYRRDSISIWSQS